MYEPPSLRAAGPDYVPPAATPEQAWAQIRGEIRGGPGADSLGSRVVRGFAESPAAIRAFHGTPHGFDRFDMSKLGTGEGAQAYGHGLYFAGSEDVARNYRDALRFRRVDNPRTVTEQITDDLNYHRGNTQRLAEIYREMVERGTPEAVALGRAKLAALDDVVAANPGHMYEVSLQTEPNRLLNWDAPLSQQPEPVRNALRGVGVDVPGGWVPGGGENVFLRMGPRGQEGQVRLIDRGHGRLEWLAEYDTLSGRGTQRFPTQDAARQWIDTQAPIEAGRGAEVYRRVGDTRGGDAAAAKVLRDRGIDGIQYLDGGSRAAGAGSSNYVMFDDKLIDIIRRYGVLPPVLGGAAAAGSGEQ